jgi:two-component system sensor histidine kinase/response regulator
VLQRDSESNPVSLIAIIQDISERKHAEAALRESEERFRGTFENAAVGIGHLSSEGRWIRVNQRLCAITGYTREELLGRTFQDITHTDDLSNSLAPFRQLWQGHVPYYSIEKRYVRKDGSFVWIETTVSLKRDAGGEPTNTIAIIQDISERKRLEEELRQAKEVAESANHAKDEFLANVSHEIRTPMNAILGMTELVLDTPLGHDQRQNLRTVRSAADNLLGIINDLLDFSKIEAGKLELDSAEFSLRAILGDIVRALGARAHRKGLELLSTVQPNVPDALIGDGGRLRQVLLNLVGNAIKFTERGEVLVRIDAIAEQTPTDNRVSLRFAVRDTGIGIPREKQTAIFRAFEQENTSTTRKYGGTGLGLTISARLVALMGGGISVESEPGRGSAFTFDAQFTKQSGESDVADTAQPVQLHKLRVLVVDDNATNRQLMEKWLCDWQMEPATVADGMAAMDALWHGVAVGNPYSLLLLDARMPDTDGLTLAAKIRDRVELSGSRIVLLTSGDRPEESSRFPHVRIDGYLLKPIQQDELLQTIYSVMSRTSDATPMRTTPVESAKARTSTKPLCVLVAEDSEFNAQLMQELLAKRGHRVRLARNGREALQLAHADAFDLLLLDVHMPELDGFQVIEAVRQREQGTGWHLPVIALTARSRKEDRERCLSAGMDGFLTKPVGFEELWATIDEVLNGTSKRDSRAQHVLNTTVLLAACGGDDEILHRISQRLQSTLPTELASVRRDLENGDAKGLRESAHRLCGMVSAFSSVLSGIASEVEDGASRGELDAARPLVEKLNSISQELLNVLAAGMSVASLRGEHKSAD